MREPRTAAVDDTPPLGLDNLLAGFRFMRRTPVLLGAITLDLFAVLFGGAVALLPLFAPSFWHSNRNKALISALLALPTAAYLLLAHRDAGAGPIVPRNVRRAVRASIEIATRRARRASPGS